MFNPDFYPLFFCCANSSRGFTELFSSAYTPENDWRVYIIKGGPGTGKSTAMKKIAERLRKSGETVALSPCTADPGSLDGVFLPERNIMIADGTAPHVLEPKCIGGCEQLVDFSEALDFSVLHSRRDEITAAARTASAHHKSAYRFLSAAGELISDARETALPALDIGKTNAFAEHLADRYLAKTAGMPSEQIRFLSGVTCAGTIYFDKTASLLGCKTISLCDPYAVCAPQILKTLRRISLARGYNIITCKNPLFPDITDHIIIPEAHICVSSMQNGGTKVYTRRFFSRSLTDGEQKDIRKSRRIADSLIAQASARMARAKSAHDKLEQLYIPAVDFDRVNRITERLYEEIIERITNET